MVLIIFSLLLVWYVLKLAKFGQLKVNASTNLFAMAVGIKQKDLVNKMVKKVISRGVLYKLFITNVLF